MPIDCIMLLHFSWNARDSICRKCINKNTLRKTFAENLNFRHTPSYAKCFDTSAYQQTAFERPKIYFITENRRRSRFSIEQYEMVLFFGVGCQTRVVAASGHYSYSNKQTSLRMAVLEISRGETRHFYSVIILKKAICLYVKCGRIQSNSMSKGRSMLWRHTVWYMTVGLIVELSCLRNGKKNFFFVDPHI